MLQADKQSKYADTIGRAPKISQETINSDGLYEFHMEYIPGETLAHHLHTVSLSEIKDISNKLISLLQRETSVKLDAQSIFNEKISSLEKTLSSDSPPSVKLSLKHLKKVDWSQCEPSPCHGDLTLENILISDNNLYLIDFLDSFYDSWMIDVAKILQDAECFWSYRNQEISDNLQIRLLSLKNNVLSHIRENTNGSQQIILIYEILLLNLLRILPYTKDNLTLEYLHKEIGRLYKKIITKSI